MDLFRNMISHRKQKENSSPELSSEHPLAAASDSRVNTRSVPSGGAQESKPSVDPRLSTSKEELSPMELKVQQLCEIFPQVARNEIKSMLPQYSYSTDLVASVLLARETDNPPRAAGGHGGYYRCPIQCPRCGGHHMVKTPQRHQYAQLPSSRTAMPPQRHSSGVERYHSAWGSEHGTSQPFASASAYPTQRPPLDGGSYNGDDG